MLKELSPEQKTWIDETLINMSVKEKICHVLCPNIRLKKESLDDIKRMLDNYPVGALFFFSAPADELRRGIEVVQEHSKVPVIACMDILWGAGHVILDKCTYFVSHMACGAADSPELTYGMGKSIAVESRAHGIHWTLGPIADVNVNINSPIVNFRAFGDSPVHVARHARAFVAGVQDTGLMAATAKHFPGDGIDDRDQHFVTSVNSLSREEWMKVFGSIYKPLIDDGLQAVMSGHIALPCVDPSVDDTGGHPPGSLSKPILQGLLREELGFDGCVITDAIRMTGLTCHVAPEDIAWKLIDAGNDVVLFSELERDYLSLKKAVEEGNLSEERLNDAIRRILELKCRVDIHNNPAGFDLSSEDKAKHEALAMEMSTKSIKVVRDIDAIIPLSLEKGAKVLTITIEYPRTDDKFIFLDQIDDELRERGFEVDNIQNPEKGNLKKIAEGYDAIFVNINVGAHARSGIIRMTKELLSVFEDIATGVPGKIVITSFGDPYKIYEIPYVRTMINTFSPTPMSIKSAVKIWLGEAEPGGKNPVALKGFFEREVE